MTIRMLCVSVCAFGLALSAGLLVPGSSLAYNGRYRNDEQSDDRTYPRAVTINLPEPCPETTKVQVGSGGANPTVDGSGTAVDSKGKKANSVKVKSYQSVPSSVPTNPNAAGSTQLASMDSVGNWWCDNVPDAACDNTPQGREGLFASWGEFVYMGGGSTWQLTCRVYCGVCEYPTRREPVRCYRVRASRVERPRLAHEAPETVDRITRLLTASGSTARGAELRVKLYEDPQTSIGIEPDSDADVVTPIGTRWLILLRSETAGVDPKVSGFVLWSREPGERHWTAVYREFSVKLQ